jgi:hypothetical protein
VFAYVTTVGRRGGQAKRMSRLGAVESDEVLALPVMAE